MSQIVIFKRDQSSNLISVLIPTPECLENYSIDTIAQKDVPSGVPYKILNLSDLPEEAQYWDEFFDAIEWDGSEADGVGSVSNQFEEA